MDQLNSAIFDLCPTPMWLQDYSELKKLFEEWRAQGITDLYQYLIDNPHLVSFCRSKIKTIAINPSTLKVYEAKNELEIFENFRYLIGETKHFHDNDRVLLSLWDGQTEFSTTLINYTMKGNKIDIKLRGFILPGYEDTWERLLLTSEDITDYQNARRFAESMFTYSPTALMVKDYSQIKLKFDNLIQTKIENFETYITEHPAFIQECFDAIKLLGINQAALQLFGADNTQILEQNIQHIFSIDSNQSFREQLILLWNGEFSQKRESIYYTLDDQKLNVLEQFTVFPDFKEDWAVIQVALTDITERKAMENHLKFLGKHDILTKLYNRTFYIEEVQRLKKNSIAPISCIFLDINGLKEINDSLGHDQGDEILKRFGVILTTAIEHTHYSASRIGGDEFVILMPQAKQSHIDALLNLIKHELEVDQIKNPEMPIRVAIGYASTNNHENIEELLKKADEFMYKNKQAYYQSNSLIP